MVLEPEARILGEPEMYFRAASDVSLTCVSTGRSSFVFWYLDDIRVSEEGDDRVGIEKSVRGAERVDRLLIGNATEFDSGVYTCLPTNAAKATVTVHIMPGEDGGKC